jgi:hypothetical protein
MLLPVMINGERLLALLDTASTHNFLPVSTMRRLALQPTGGEPLRVTVGNGNRLHSHGIARQVPISVGNEHFTITCVGIDLGYFDFILGVDFLQTLGPILWDFDTMSMVFWRMGRRVRWEGVGDPSSVPPHPQLTAAAAELEQPMLAQPLPQHSDLFDEPLLAAELLRGRDEILAEGRQRLLQALQLSRRYYDAHHHEAEFAVGDWVWLRLLHRSTQSLDPRAKRALGPRYAGPFQVLEHIGNVVYRLQLPPGARIHDVFHVGLLKPFRGAPPAATPYLPPTSDDRLLPATAKILKAQQSYGVWRVLVQWQGLPEEDTTGEHLDEFRPRFPD